MKSLMPCSPSNQACDGAKNDHMADPVLHIKDSYYFEVPKLLYPYDYRSRQQFPGCLDFARSANFRIGMRSGYIRRLTAASGLPPQG